MPSAATTRAPLPAVADAGSPAGAALASVALRVPDRVVPNAEVCRRLGVTEDWIVGRTGVRQRRIARDDERLTDLAAAAGAAALARAELSASDLDLVLVATLAADDLTPNAAPLVAGALGADRAGAFDVGAACTGFITGLSIAAGQVECGRAGSVLLIGADLLSRVTDPGDRRTAGLLADGAGAAVVTRAAAGTGRIGPILLGAAADEARTIHATHDERTIHMQGHDTFREAVRRLSEATVASVERAGRTLSEIDLFVYHQANARILTAVADRLSLDGERVIDCIDRYGNTSAATLPIALTEAEAAGRLRPGAVLLVAAFGAGFTWGAGLVEW